MSWDPFSEIIGNLGSVSILVLIAAALVYYFGRNIVNQNPRRPRQTSDYYSAGIGFVLWVIAIPATIAFLFTWTADFYLPLWSSLLIQFIVFVCFWFVNGAISVVRWRGGSLVHAKSESLEEKKNHTCLFLRKERRATSFGHDRLPSSRKFQ